MLTNYFFIFITMNEVQLYNRKSMYVIVNSSGKQNTKIIKQNNKLVLLFFFFKSKNIRDPN